jgi:hypothetical protein
MPNVNLTPDNVETLPPPPAGKPAILYRDEGMDRTLILRVSPTGSRSWLIEAKNAAGRSTQRAFGAYPSLSLAQARRAIPDLEANIAAEGTTSAAEAPRALTLRQVFDDWKESKHPKDTTSHTYASVIKTNAAEWWDRPIRAIKREEILAKCKAAWEGRGAERQGDQFFQTMRALFNHHQVVPNPAANITPKSDKTKVEAARPLAPEVLAALLDALESLSIEGRTYYTVLLLPGSALSARRPCAGST